jgi:N-dimethylarginine dimethylaminohydrolase
MVLLQLNNIQYMSESEMLEIGVDNQDGELVTALFHKDIEANATEITMEEQVRLLSHDRLPGRLAMHPETGPVDRAKTIEQQHAVQRILEAHHVRLVSPVSVEGAFCQRFVCDSAGVVGDTLFSSRPNPKGKKRSGMADAWREDELKGLVRLKRDVRKLVEVASGIVEFGDVMPVNSGLVFIGVGPETTDAEGAAFMIEQMKKMGREGVIIEHTGLHLDAALGIKGEEALVTDRLPASSRDIVRRYVPNLVDVDEEEARLALATQFLSLSPETVMSTAQAPKTNALLREKGYEVLEPDQSELPHIWSAVRGIVCPLLRKS